MSQLMSLKCGCILPFSVDGKASTHMFDGISGFNVKCLLHGWTLKVCGNCGQCKPCRRKIRRLEMSRKPDATTCPFD